MNLKHAPCRYDNLDVNFASFRPSHWSDDPAHWAKLKNQTISPFKTKMLKNKEQDDKQPNRKSNRQLDAEKGAFLKSKRRKSKRKLDAEKGAFLKSKRTKSKRKLDADKGAFLRSKRNSILEIKL